jgi:hypothetical protein
MELLEVDVSPALGLRKPFWILFLQECSIVCARPELAGICVHATGTAA